MFRNSCVVLAAIWLACVAAFAAPSDIGKLAAEFRLLRTQSGHFSGGDWNDAVDRFGGRKHVVMQALGEALGDGRHTRAEVIRLLGAPDRVYRRGSPDFRNFYDGKDPRVRVLMVYHWRGGHDFLYLTCSGARVRGHGWWMAYE